MTPFQIGMIKSPVEGSTAALVRLETPVVYSDYVRPICLPDALNEPNQAAAAAHVSNTSNTYPDTLPEEPLSRTKKDGKVEVSLDENRDYFLGPSDSQISEDDFEEDGDAYPVRNARAIPTEYFSTSTGHTSINERQNLTKNEEPRIKPSTTEATVTTQWATCNTIGWNRQREHLQRVQLKFSNMATCENISIATVNSMCTEAAFHKQDCSEEEFAGSPVMCIMPNSNKWALAGIASWRIACATNGVERPRMYDKITPNSAWIRKTINST